MSPKDALWLIIESEGVAVLFVALLFMSVTLSNLLATAPDTPYKWVVVGAGGVVAIWWVSNRRRELK